MPVKSKICISFHLFIYLFTYLFISKEYFDQMTEYFDILISKAFFFVIYSALMNTVEVPFRTKIRSTKMDTASRINFLPFLAHTEIWKSYLKGNEHLFFGV